MGTRLLQQRFLRSIFDRGLAPKDEALAAHVAEIDEEPCHRTLVQKWRAGTREAPLGVLFALLDLVDDQRSQQGILQVIARRYHLRVVVDLADAVAAAVSLESRLLDAYELLAGFRRAFQQAGEDGVLDDTERLRLLEHVDALEREVAGMRALLATGKTS